ncbi:MAG: hypothetical protein ACE366_20015 [Bradymonadia bacterium]
MAKRRDLDPHRRRLLLQMAGGTMVMGSAGLWLPGCEAPRTDGLVPPHDGGVDHDAAFLPQIDVDALRSEVWMEDRAIQAYEVLGPGLSEPLQPVAQLFRDHHWAHRQDGRDKLEAMGVTPPAAPTELPENMPDLEEGDIPILEYALLLEIQSVRSYMGLIAQMQRDSHRYASSNILGSELSHVLALQAALGDGQPQVVGFVTDILEE